MKHLLVLALIFLIVTALLGGCDPVTGVQQYDARTGAYSCPSGSYPDLDDRGQQICRSARR